MRQLAALRAHLHQTTSQDNLPSIGTKRADTAHRQGVAERFPAPAVHKRIDGALALSDHDDERLGDLELGILNPAKPPATRARGSGRSQGAASS